MIEEGKVAIGRKRNLLALVVFAPEFKAAKVIEGLLARSLVVDADGQNLLTDADYTAVDKKPQPPGQCQACGLICQRS